MNECRRCTRPTDRYACETCADDLARALGDIPALVEELDTTITGQRGIDYRRGRTNAHDAPTQGVKGDRPDLGVHVQPLLGNQRATGARTHLVATLMAWCRYCHEHEIRNSSPVESLPRSMTPEAMSRWLMWRVDGLTLDQHGPAAVDQITKAVARSERVIDRPADKWFAGPCDECGVDMYANPTASAVVCPACNLEYDVAARRAWLLAEARNYLATAVEIARAVTVLGEYTRSGESGLVSRLDKWRSRNRITVHGHKFVDGKQRPMYRVGEVLDLLADDLTGEGARG